MSRVTVLMPVYNGARFVEQAVRSVLQQTHHDLRLVVIDDGSVDDTLPIVSEVRDERLTVVSQTNQGIVSALNHGLNLTDSLLVARADADDICHPQRFERQLSVMAQQPALVVLGSWYEHIDDEGRSLETVVTMVSPDDVHLELLARNPIAHGTVMMRTSAVRHAGGYRSCAGAAEDYDLWVRMAACGGRLANLPEVLYSHRLHAESVSTTSKRQTSDARAARGRAWSARHNIVVAQIPWHSKRDLEDVRLRRHATKNLLLISLQAIRRRSWRTAIRCLAGGLRLAASCR